MYLILIIPCQATIIQGYLKKERTLYFHCGSNSGALQDRLGVLLVTLAVNGDIGSRNFKLRRNHYNYYLYRMFWKTMVLSLVPVYGPLYPGLKTGANQDHNCSN